MTKTMNLWISAIIITLGSVFFQRMTGPSYPAKINQTLPSGKILKCQLLTSHESNSDAPVVIPVTSEIASGIVSWRRVNSSDDWSQIPLDRRGDTLVAFLPKQPAAGKAAYNVELTAAGGEKLILTEQPVVIRFKDPVPLGVLAPHIAFMFISMLLATRTGLEAFTKRNRSLPLAIWTTIFLLIGGLILGPIVQKYAFGAFWTGWPFGHDLTDNKTALAMLIWVVSIWRGRSGKNARWWYIVAAIVHLLVYLVPHSVLGSELDYTSGPSSSSLG
ncbi:MAG: hypothetical protein WBP29_04890 [Candidatus Zixiibacteriota bacterium]